MIRETSIPQPSPGHWCHLRSRRHYEPCGCFCDPCASYRAAAREHRVIPVPRPEDGQ